MIFLELSVDLVRNLFAFPVAGGHAVPHRWWWWWWWWWMLGRKGIRVGILSGRVVVVPCFDEIWIDLGILNPVSDVTGVFS
jgi:hypothetical protein